jgi:hypothetical protein
LTLLDLQSRKELYEKGIVPVEYKELRENIFKLASLKQKVETDSKFGTAKPNLDLKDFIGAEGTKIREKKRPKEESKKDRRKNSKRQTKRVKIDGVSENNMNDTNLQEVRIIYYLILRT